MTLNSICNRLSPRESEVLVSIIAGERAKETAIMLGISPRTVEIHYTHIREKLGARNSAETVRIALRGK
jgi:two-component system response regulator FixJ